MIQKLTGSFDLFIHSPCSNKGPGDSEVVQRKKRLWFHQQVNCFEPPQKLDCVCV